MDNLKINTGLKRILINDGPDYIEFDPEDVLFIEKFYQLIHEFELKKDEFTIKAANLDSNKELDANGLPSNIGEGLSFLKEICQYLRDRIDYVFGAGTSQKVFGDSLSLSSLGQFFEGVTPFIQLKRAEKLQKYMATDEAQPFKRSIHKPSTHRSSRAKNHKA